METNNKFINHLHNTYMSTTEYIAYVTYIIH
jgi:hypothetical protein